jgi:putative ABC transport system permease protein
MPAEMWADVRDAARALRRRPGFALLAVLTLAAGMSVNVVAFSVVNALLLKRPAFAHVDRLGWMFVVSRNDPHGSASLPQYESLRADARTLDAVLAEGRLPLGFSQGDRTDQVWSLAVTANYFATLGVEPAAGRLFSEGDRHQLVAVVSHEFWRERLG